MDKHTEELKRAIEREPFKKALEFLRTGKSPGVERVKNKLRTTGERAVKAERRADVIEKVAGDTGFLVKDRKAQKTRRGIAARQAGRDTRDSGLWNHYEAFRSMKRHLDLAQKEKRRLTRKQAAQRVIDSSKGAITIKPETLVRYYRDWLKRPKRKSGSD